MSRGTAMGAAVACLTLASCSADLGECDRAAAEELVYGRSGLVATKGQALAHDTCGNGIFCHSAAAEGSERWGVPAGLDFDMLPSPTGLVHMRNHAEEAWDLVRSSDMPPGGETAEVIGDGDWVADLERRQSAPRLPSLDSDAGKAVFRNWLACGAPVVTDTRVPQWAQPPAPVEASWSSIHAEVMQPLCALAGCHDRTSAAGGLALGEACEALDALLATGDCGEPPVRAGDAGASLLVDKLENAQPRCGAPMPPGGLLPATTREAIRTWIESGAEAEACR